MSTRSIQIPNNAQQQKPQLRRTRIIIDEMGGVLDIAKSDSAAVKILKSNKRDNTKPV